MSIQNITSGKAMDQTKEILFFKSALILNVTYASSLLFGCVKKRDNMTNMTNEIQDMASEMQSFQNFFVQIYHRLFYNIVYTDGRKQHRLTC